MIENYEKMPKHVHAYNGDTSVNVGHKHLFSSVTSEAPDIKDHYHMYYTITTTDNNHYHVVQGSTYPAVYKPNGSHTHIVSSVTTVDGKIPHNHDYYEISSENVAVKKK